ncbi:MAG: hypothetical protein LBV51_05795 [Acholeplasmatales bacterium]|jgi:hypothetical protein|nr:hypothetical protein [Acholeplasmatales bacterium]
MEQKYYKVKAKCGHVGNGKYIIVDFPVIAQSAKEAAEISKNIPRVKHHLKGAVVEVIQISYQDFYSLRIKNNSNSYLLCHNKREQKEMCPDLSSKIMKLNPEVEKKELCKTYKIKKQKEICEYLPKHLYDEIYEEEIEEQVYEDIDYSYSYDAI